MFVLYFYAVLAATASIAASSSDTVTTPSTDTEQRRSDEIVVSNPNGRNYTILAYVEEDESQRQNIDNVLRKTTTSNYTERRKVFKFPVYATVMFKNDEHVYMLSKRQPDDSDAESVACKYNITIVDDGAVSITSAPVDVENNNNSATNVPDGSETPDCYYTHFDNEPRDLKGLRELQLWFNLADVADFLEYERLEDALEKVDGSVEKWSELVQNPEDDVNWLPGTDFVSDHGLYRLVRHSTKPNASKFAKWILEEVESCIQYSMFGQWYDPDKTFTDLARLEIYDGSECICLATTDAYRTTGTYYVSFTSNPERLLEYINQWRMLNQEFSYIKLWPVRDCELARREISQKLASKHYRGELFLFKDDNEAVSTLDSILSSM